MIDALLQLLEWIVNGFGVGGRLFPRHTLFFSLGWGGIASVRLIRAALGKQVQSDGAGIAFGGGRYSLSKDYWLVGGHGEGGGGVVREDGRVIRAGGGLGGMDLGYLLLEAKGVRVYALGSVGGVGAGVTVEDETRSKTSGGFTGVMLHGGFGVEHRIPLRRSLALALGVRFGWVQPMLTLRIPKKDRISLPRLGSPRVQVYIGLSSDAV
jgi:hypothetical protein